MFAFFSFLVDSVESNILHNISQDVAIVTSMHLRNIILSDLKDYSLF